jgi:hypothetical protein
MKHAFAGVVKAILLSALLALTALLAGAFESRSMPALLIWHTTTRTLVMMPEYYLEYYKE